MLDAYTFRTAAAVAPIPPLVDQLERFASVLDLLGDREATKNAERIRITVGRIRKRGYIKNGERTFATAVLRKYHNGELPNV